MLRPITHGHLTALLTELGYTSRVIDRHNVVYEHKPTGSLFFLPNIPPHTPAREGDYVHIRSQLDGWGLMERDDFEMYFARLAVAADRSRTKQA
jgi:hypothetical protein